MGTPIIKQRRTEIRTEDNVIIASVQILHAPIKSKRSVLIIANLSPTEIQLMMIRAVIVYQ